MLMYFNLACLLLGLRVRCFKYIIQDNISVLCAQGLGQPSCSPCLRDSVFSAFYCLWCDRYSNEADTDGQVQRSEVCYSSSSVTQHHSGATTTVETTVSSRSSTPKQLSQPLRRRSSATSDADQDVSPIPSTGSSGFSRVARGGSVRALSQKFQQAAGEWTGIQF
jgi:hypothetical protein